MIGFRGSDSLGEQSLVRSTGGLGSRGEDDGVLGRFALLVNIYVLIVNLRFLYCVLELSINMNL